MQWLKLLHLLSVLVWVGGMFFAYVVLRPAAVDMLEPPPRLKLWNDVFRRFFKWVWTSIALLLISGIGMIALYGGMAHVGPHVHIMLALGIAMIAIYGHVYFALYKKLNRFVTAQSWKEAGEILSKIRKLVGLNLTLGLVTVCVAVSGPLFS
jgi:uncharacterized membrane protein